jgi:hypothetical protein
MRTSGRWRGTAWRWMALVAVGLGKSSEDDLTKVLSNDPSVQALGQPLQRGVTSGDTATV